MVAPASPTTLTLGGSSSSGTANPTILNIDNPYKFRVYLSGAQTITNGTFTTLQFNTKSYDTNTNFNTSNYTYTVPISGIYHFDCWVSQDAPVPDIRCLVRLRKNGSDTTIFDTIQTGDSTTNKFLVGGSDTILLTSGDVMLLDYYQSTGASKTVNVIGTMFSGYLVCPTTATALTFNLS